MDRNAEMQVKVERLRRLIAEHQWGGLVLRSRGNFAWLTAGGLSYIDASSANGVGAMLVTPERVCLLANVIESKRFIEEELVGLDVERVEFAWHDADAESKAIASIVGTGVVAGDSGACPDASAEIVALRNPLLETEVARYKALGVMAVELTEAACRDIRPGQTEDDVYADVQQRFHRAGARVPVCLIAADQRITLRRHPITKGKPIERRVMVVVCAEQHGLWVNLTRLVNFAKPDGELTIKHRACCQVDVAAHVATRPGRTLGEVFDVIVDEYARQGFADEWKLHHQGGSTGYAGRDCFAAPGCVETVGVDQAFAWNPSITGTKVEDTILVTDSGFDMITAPGDDWPAIEVEREGVTMRRADILVNG